MKKIISLIAGGLIALPLFARDFIYEYEGKAITYTVIDEAAKTCKTKDGKSATGAVILPAIAKDGDNDYTLIEIGEYTFSQGSLTSVVIPNTVKTIGYAAFINCLVLNKAEIPESLTTIGEYAFGSCSSLASAEIPNSVTTIGKAAFLNCSALTSVNIPEGITAIEDNTFVNCTGLTEVTIPGSVKSIGLQAFGGCTGLTSIIIPDSVETIGVLAFRDCVNLTDVVIGNSVETIEISAFYKCTALKAIVIPNSLKSLGDNTFSGCSALTSAIIGNSVESVGNEVFIDCTSLRSITIPSSVTSVGRRAFKGCSSLASVIIGDSVAKIDNEAFAGCKSLISVVIPPSVTSLGEDAFFPCIGLKKSAYPAHLENPFEWGVSIKYPADANITADSLIYASDGSVLYYAPLSLEGKFEIPATVTTVAQSALQDCDDVDAIVIPPSVATIASKAFYGCGYLSEVTFEDGDDQLDFASDALGKCIIGSLYMGRNWTPTQFDAPLVADVSSLTIGNHVTAIPDRAFSGCSSLRWVKIGDGVNDIGNYAFYGCSSLTKVEFDDAVKNIGSSAFAGCSSLTKVEIPASVISLGWLTFSDCNNLTFIKMLGSNPPSIWDSFTNYDCTLDIPGDDIAKTSYFAGQWAKFERITINGIPTKLFSHGGLAYRLIQYPDNKEAIVVTGDYSSLTDIEIPDRVTDTDFPDYPVRYNITVIANDAFRQSSVKTVTFSSRSKVSNIGRGAFAQCGNLTSIELPNSVKTIGNLAFTLCSGLKSVVIGNSVETIGEYAFSGCSSLASIKIGNSVKNIGDRAFAECGNLNSVYIPESVENIGSEAFYLCFSIKKAVYSSIESLCRIKFSDGNSNPLSLYCPGDDFNRLYVNDERVDDVVIPETVTSIGRYAFTNAIGIKSVSIPESVTNICDYAFENCTGLTSMEIPGSVKTIGKNAFSRCSGLTSVVIGKGVENIGERVFYNCERLTTVNIPNSVTAVSDYAFSRCSGLKSVNIPNSVASIGNGAFSDCSGLTGELIIPNCVTTIGNSAFSNCSGLASVEIPNSVQTIGDYAFGNCGHLLSVEIGDGVKTIGSQAFSFCRTLWSVLLGKSVEVIGRRAFSDCDNLGEIYSLNPKAPTAVSDVFDSYNKLRYLVVYVPEGSIEDYTLAEGWSQVYDIRELDSVVKLIINEHSMVLEVGETAELEVRDETLTVNNLSYIICDTEQWTSDNEAVATVDRGVVKAIGAGTATITYSVDDRFGYTHSVACEVSVQDNTSGIYEMSEGIRAIDYDEPYEVYDLSGVKVGDSVDGLVKGLYIVRQGDKVSKIAR